MTPLLKSAFALLAYVAADGVDINRLPELVCRPGNYLTTCLKLSPTDCHERVRVEIKPCLALKKSLDSSRGEARRLAAVGSCVGERLAKNLKADRSASADCANPELWR